MRIEAAGFGRERRRRIGAASPFFEPGGSDQGVGSVCKIKADPLGSR